MEFIARYWDNDKIKSVSNIFFELCLKLQHNCTERKCLSVFEPLDKNTSRLNRKAREGPNVYLVYQLNLNESSTNSLKYLILVVEAFTYFMDSLS